MNIKLGNEFVSHLELFNPEYLKRREAVCNKNGRFVYYTSAETAMKMIHNKEVWLRNAKGMNDFLEVVHGFECFREAFKDSTEGKSLRGYIKCLFPRLVDKLVMHIDGWYPILRDKTYILSVSEHKESEDPDGRLSMWRAYGGGHPVAVVLKNGPFLNDTDAFKAYSYPVRYKETNHIKTQFTKLESRLRNKEYFIKMKGENYLVNGLFHLFKETILCTKHPGFEEEQEWRVVYCPDYVSSENVISSIESIEGVPQQVYKIKLKNLPEEGFHDATIPEVVDSILIGPCDGAFLLKDAFQKLLSHSGCNNADQIVYCSGIPIR